MHYGKFSPPIYNLSNIPHNLPLFLSYGGRDSLSDIRDVEVLLDILKLHDVGKLTVQYIKDYAHADFIMGLNAKDIVYNQVTAFFQQQQWYYNWDWSWVESAATCKPYGSISIEDLTTRLNV